MSAADNITLETLRDAMNYRIEEGANKALGAEAMRIIDGQMTASLLYVIAHHIRAIREGQAGIEAAIERLGDRLLDSREP